LVLNGEPYAVLGWALPIRDPDRMIGFVGIYRVWYAARRGTDVISGAAMKLCGQDE
jgi:hypothetical protein